MTEKERTLAIIKPDAVKRQLAGTILSRIERAGFRIIGLKLVRLSKERAENFYAVHRSKPFFASLTEFMSSGPIIVMALQGKRVIDDYRSFIGSTDPAQAGYGTIRRDYGTSIERNVVHGSDSPENGLREVRFFFEEHECLGDE
ncbi:nucleoside-diphosphate kinase [bacterium]|nr:nucleoside-diphosphate kinase [bacterium]